MTVHCPFQDGPSHQSPPMLGSAFRGLMTGHRPSSCAPQSPGFHISSAHPEGPVFRRTRYGKHRESATRWTHQYTFPVFLTFASIRRGFLLRFPPHKYSMQHMRPHSNCANVVSIFFFFVSGWCAHMFTSLNRDERARVGKWSGRCQTLNKSATEVLSLSTWNN